MRALDVDVLALEPERRQVAGGEAEGRVVLLDEPQRDLLGGLWLLPVRVPSRRASIRTVPVVPSMSKTAFPGSDLLERGTGPRPATRLAVRAAMARAVLDCP